MATRPSLAHGLTRFASAVDVDVIIRWGKTGAGATRSELQAKAGSRDDGTPALGDGVLAAFQVSAGVDICASPSPVPSPVPVVRVEICVACLSSDPGPPSGVLANVGMTRRTCTMPLFSCPAESAPRVPRTYRALVRTHGGRPV